MNSGSCSLDIKPAIFHTSILKAPECELLPVGPWPPQQSAYLKLLYKHLPLFTLGSNVYAFFMHCWSITELTEYHAESPLGRGKRVGLSLKTGNLEI